MATYTQHKQPYGRVVRREYPVDGSLYIVRFVGKVYEGEKWELRLALGPAGDRFRHGTERVCWVVMPDGSDIEQAAQRLGVRG